MFAGFPEATIRFFLSLRFNNHTSFFQEQKDTFVRDVQAPFYAFIQAMGPTVRQIDSAMEIRPAKCLARIRRDTRFSRDKSPYRDHLWVLFRRAAQPRAGSLMFWFELTPEEVDWGLGFFGGNRPAMDALRRRMAAQPQAFLEVLSQCRLEERKLCLGGDAYKRMAVPPQIPPELRPWYLARHLYLRRMDTRLKWIYDPGILHRVAEDYLALAPLYRLLRDAADEAGGAL